MFIYILFSLRPFLKFITCCRSLNPTKGEIRKESSDFSHSSWLTCCERQWD